MAARTGIHVRLDAGELEALRQIPGDSDAGRLRTLLSQQRVAEVIAEASAAAARKVVAAEIERFRRQQEAVIAELTEVFRREIESERLENREMVKRLAAQINTILSKRGTPA